MQYFQQPPDQGMPDEIVLARMMTSLDLKFMKLCTTMIKNMTVTMTMDSHLEL